MSDYEMPRVASIVTPKARRPHACCECPRPIQPGDRYERVKGNWDGAWSTYRTCLPCVALRERWSADGWVYGELHQVLEQIGDDDEEAAAWLRLGGGS